LELPNIFFIFFQPRIYENTKLNFPKVLRRMRSFFATSDTLLLAACEKLLSNINLSCLSEIRAVLH
jgi:hypothetical protein